MQVAAITWWLVGACLVATATLSQSLWALLLVTAIAEAANRTVSRARGLEVGPRNYIWFAALVLAARIGVRLLFGVWPVSLNELLAATTEGMRLVAILFAVAMASTLANPRSLLRVVPSGLYEVATAIVVALNLAPQLGPSLLRVRRAAALRGRSSGLGSFAAIVVPTLEDALDQSLALAASMESRGFGAHHVDPTGAGSSRGAGPSRLRGSSGALVLSGLAALSAACISLVSFGRTWLAALAGGVGLAALLLGLRGRGDRTSRTTFVRLRFGLADVLALTMATVVCVACLAMPVVLL